MLAGNFVSFPLAPMSFSWLSILSIILGTPCFFLFSFHLESLGLHTLVLFASRELSVLMLSVVLFLAMLHGILGVA